MNVQPLWLTIKFHLQRTCFRLLHLSQACDVYEAGLCLLCLTADESVRSESLMIGKRKSEMMRVSFAKQRSGEIAEVCDRSESAF